MSDERKYIYEGEEIFVSSEYTPTQVREIWSTVYAGVASAEIRENEDGSVTFVKTGGTKG